MRSDDERVNRRVLSALLVLGILLFVAAWTLPALIGSDQPVGPAPCVDAALPHPVIDDTPLLASRPPVQHRPELTEAPLFDDRIPPDALQPIPEPVDAPEPPLEQPQPKPQPDGPKPLPRGPAQPERRRTRQPNSFKTLWLTRTAAAIAGSPAATDFNGDGVPDVVVTNTVSKDHRSGRDVLAINGRDGSRLWRATPYGGIFMSPALADLDGDEVPDVVVGSWARNICAFGGRDGSSLWRVRTAHFVESSAAFGDLTGDGVPDVVCGSHDRYVHAICGRSGRLLWKHNALDRVKASPLLLDLNDDGVLDIVYAAMNCRATALDGLSRQEMWRQPLSGPVALVRLLNADVNGDGADEILIPCHGGELVAVSPAGQKLWGVATPSTLESTPAVEDFNGDGAADCAFTDNGGTVFVVNGRDGKPFWRKHTPAASSTSIALIHFNADDVPDLIYGTATGGMEIRSGTNGALLFRARVNLTMQWSTPVVADLTGDGLPEVVLTGSRGKVCALTALPYPEPEAVRRPPYSVVYQRDRGYQPLTAQEAADRAADWALREEAVPLLLPVEEVNRF